MRRILSLFIVAALLFGVAATSSAAGALELRELWPLGGNTDPANGQTSVAAVTSFSAGYGAALRVMPFFAYTTSPAGRVSSGGFLDSAGQGWPMPDYNPASDAARVRPTTITTSDESVVHVDWIGFEYPHVVLIAMGEGSANVTITDQMGKQAVIPVQITNQRGSAWNYDTPPKPVTIGNREWPFSIMMPQYVQPAFALMRRYADVTNEYYAIFTSVPNKLGHKMIYKAGDYGSGDTLTVPAGARLIVPDRMIWSLGNITLRVEGTLVIARGGYLNLFAEAGKSAAIEIGPSGAIDNDGLIVATETGMIADADMERIGGDGAVGLMAYSDMTWDAGGNYDPDGDAVASDGVVTIVKRPLLDPADGTALEQAARTAGYSAFGEKFELQAWSGKRSSAADLAEGVISTLPQAQTVTIPYSVESGVSYQAAHKRADGSVVYEDMHATADGTGLSMTISECSPFMIVKRGGGSGDRGGGAAMNSDFLEGFDLNAWKLREQEEKRLREEKLKKTPVAGVPSTGGAACGILLILLSGALLTKRNGR